MTSGVMCQVRFPRLLKPDSLSARWPTLRLKLEALWHPPGGTPVSKQPKLDKTLPAREFSKRKCRVPSVAVNTFGIRSKSTEAKKAVCFVSRTWSWEKEVVVLWRLG